MYRAAQTRYRGKSLQSRDLADFLLYGVVQETQGTGRNVKYVHFSEVAVSKAFSLRSLTHQTTDEANSSSDVPVPPSISVEAASPTLTLPAEQQEHEVADNTLSANLLQCNGTEWKVVGGVIENRRCMPKFGAHILWGNDVDEARRTPFDYAEQVGRNCAKLHYLMKLAVLESVVSKPTVDEQVQYMKQLQPLVSGNGNPFSVFTYICSTSSMAQKVAASSNRLPIIARLDSPLHVVIRGVGITTDQVRAVYHQALHRCQILATELLMGVRNASVVEAWDDFVQGRIMASRDVSKDKAIRCALLTHILRSDIHLARMVDSIQEGVTITILRMNR